LEEWECRAKAEAIRARQTRTDIDLERSTPPRTEDEP